MNNAIGNLHANSQAWEVGKYSIDLLQKDLGNPLGTFHFLSAPPPLRIFAKGGSDSYFKVADKI